MPNPLVSIIIPAYNKADFTVKAVESVLNQTYHPIEIIVVDDGSTDDTQKKLHKFLDKVFYFRQDNGGACRARNTGLRLAKGEFIGFLDCDDMYAPNKVSLCIEYLNENLDIGMVHTTVFAMDKDDRLERVLHNWYGSIHQGLIKEKLIIRNFIYNPTVLIRRKCFNDSGFFNEAIFPPADWDMWLRISEFYKIGFINEPLSYYRTTSQWSVKHLDQLINDSEIVLRDFFTRNSDVPLKIKYKAYGQHYLRMARHCLAAGQMEDAKDFIIESQRENPWNGKLWIFQIQFILMRNHLIKQVKRSLFME